MKKINSLIKERPKFSILALVLFCLFFAAAGIYLIYQSKAAAMLNVTDEFNSGPLNSSIWRGLTPYYSHYTGGSDPELQYYKDANMSFVNGGLRLTTKKETTIASSGTYNYSSGIITSLNQPKVSYGYYEMRAKLPKTQGIWPAFWLTNDQSLEIDVFELLGERPTRVYMTLHRNGSTIYQAYYDGPDFSLDYHTFAVDWQPTHIKWYIDGVKRAEFLPSSKGWGSVPSDPLWIIANTAVGGAWPLDPDPVKTVLPQYYDIDYIRAFTSKPATTTEPPADTVAPNINFTAPTDGATISGNVTVSANATDNVGISYVDFYVDGIKKATKSSIPYSYILDTSTLTVGSHTMTARTHDTSDLTANHIINVNVVRATVTPPPPDNTTDPNLIAPTINILTPTDGSIIDIGKVCISVTAIDAIRISTISYYLDGKLLSTQTTYPYKYYFPAKKAKTGTHTIKAVLTDIQGRTATDQVTVTKK